MELVFCTNNAHKLQEVAQILGDKYAYKTLKDISYFDDIPEPFDTLEENSFTKANQVFQHTGLDCFAEDTGLFIEALQEEPGVFSARYAGEQANAGKNIQKVLSKLEGEENRKAYFKTVITLLQDGMMHQFEGICNGSIALEKYGDGGFGYDPIFIPEGFTQCFAELDASTKNEVSHRKKAFDAMSQYLNTKYFNT